MAKKTTRRPGRPQGAKNKPVEHAEAAPSRCPKCGSTERGSYVNKIANPLPTGRTPTGEPATHVVKRRTHCKACGQHRIDYSYENRPAPPKARPATKNKARPEQQAGGRNGIIAEAAG